MNTRSRRHPDLWLDPEDDPRSDRLPRGELDTLTDYLGNYRLTLQLKCADLVPEQLAARSVPPSTLSLLGLVRHAAAVEHSWFRRVLERQPELPRLWGKDENRNADFEAAVGTQECVDEAFTALRAEIAHAEQFVANATSLDVTGRLDADNEIELRVVLVHLIEEYARHCGHADLLRECIDGRTGQ